MKYSYLKIVGLMTGTSMDGIDVSLVSTNGIGLKRLNQNYFYEYSKKTKKILLELLRRENIFNIKRKIELDNIVTNEHFKALKKSNILNECDYIGFHGQTIFHDPKNKYSVQLGNPKKLAELCRKNVIYDFRSNDLMMGGQGAPIAPIYHKLIIETKRLNLPCCFLNIGGVANITYWDGKKLIGFDTGPGNALMDNYMQKISKGFYDKDGLLASQGKLNKQAIEVFKNDEFFKLDPPKSLDRNSFLHFYNNLISQNVTPSDVMATLAEFTVISIKLAFNHLPKNVENIIVTGGGYYNKYLMKRIKSTLNAKFYSENDLNLQFNYIESELIAYLSARSIYQLPFTYPSTTGVSKPSSGGRTLLYL